MIPKLPPTYTTTLYVYGKLYAGDLEPHISVSTWKREGTDYFFIKELVFTVELPQADMNVVAAQVGALREAIQNGRAEFERQLQEKQAEIEKLLSLTYEQAEPS